MKYATNLVAGGTSPTGGSGNPGAAGLAHGWNVRILSQSSTQALVRIWNGSPFAMNSIRRLDATSLSLSFESVPGRTLALQVSSNPAVPGGGFTVQTNVSGMTNVTVPAASPRRFYRLGVP
jgi:hypothetical protein